MELTEEQLAELRAAVRQDIYDGSVQARAKIVLWYHEGHRKTEIAKMSGASRPTIDLWLRSGSEGTKNTGSTALPRGLRRAARG
jgi:transposase